ncbi:hypothetical protein [Saccharopolyspora spinosa]|uniref:hypothetical protein n=1 Tax=Saccharopolyspora spinosa TaxID=60894 RepID=UPI00376EEBA4
MWAARFGSGIGEALSEGLGELFSEVGYQAATGQEVTWNPYSVTAGVFESVFSGVGNLAGLVWRGKLHPEGPSPYLDDTSQREGTTTDGGGFDDEKAPLLGAGSGSQIGNIPGSPDKDNTFTPPVPPMARMARSRLMWTLFSRSGRWIRLRCRCPPVKTPWCPLLWTARTTRMCRVLGSTGRVRRRLHILMR